MASNFCNAKLLEVSDAYDVTITARNNIYLDVSFAKEVMYISYSIYGNASNIHRKTVLKK